MAASKRPALEDAATVGRVLLDGLAQGTEIFDLLGELEPLHPRNDTFPGEVFLHLAADALEWCGASRVGPLALEGIRERFLPECRFRGRQNKKLQYAVLAARPSMAEPSPTCWTRSSGGRPMTCSRRSPTFAPPPAGPACL
jgi:hypothetical protein